MNRHNDKPISEVLQAFIRDRQMQDRLYQVQVTKLWAKLMGPSVDEYTREIKLRKRKLYITIESAALRQELLYGKEKVRDLFNSHLGENFIEEVVIR